MIDLEKENQRLKDWLVWISEHNVTETEIPENLEYVNMSPSEGAALAVAGKNVQEYWHRNEKNKHEEKS